MHLIDGCLASHMSYHGITNRATVNRRPPPRGNHTSLPSPECLQRYHVILAGVREDTIHQSLSRTHGLGHTRLKRTDTVSDTRSRTRSRTHGPGTYGLGHTVSDNSLQRHRLIPHPRKGQGTVWPHGIKPTTAAVTVLERVHPPDGFAPQERFRSVGFAPFLFSDTRSRTIAFRQLVSDTRSHSC